MARKHYVVFRSKVRSLEEQASFLDIWPGDTVAVLEPWKGNGECRRLYVYTGTGNLVEAG